VPGQVRRKDVKKYTNKAGMCMKEKKSADKMAHLFAHFFDKVQVFRTMLAKLERKRGRCGVELA
jgi:hypothetical protein